MVLETSSINMPQKFPIDKSRLKFGFPSNKKILRNEKKYKFLNTNRIQITELKPASLMANCHNSN